MEFNDYLDHYTFMRRLGVLEKDVTPRQFLSGIIAEFGQRNPNLVGQVQTECRWVDAGRPYYLMYPSVANSLSKVSLEIKTDRLKLPLPNLLIRLPVGGWRGILSILACHITTHDGEGLGVWVDQGERGPDGSPIYMYRKFRLDHDETVEEAAENIPVDFELTDEENERTRMAIRLTLACALLDVNDPLVQPDVLSKDRAKLDSANAERLHDKAKRRGKFGWVVGSNEVSPHFRRPHFAIRWTGKGRTVPKLTSIKGSTVHRDKITKVPTGRSHAE